MGSRGEDESAGEPRRMMSGITRSHACRHKAEIWGKWGVMLKMVSRNMGVWWLHAMRTVLQGNYM